MARTDRDGRIYKDRFCETDLIFRDEYLSDTDKDEYADNMMLSYYEM